MPRKKRPPIPQSTRKDPTPAKRRSPVVTQSKSQSNQDRLAIYLYYVPLLLASWLILPHEISFTGGTPKVRHWLWVLVIPILFLIGPPYLKAMSKLRAKYQSGPNN